MVVRSRSQSGTGPTTAKRSTTMLTLSTTHLTSTAVTTTAPRAGCRQSHTAATIAWGARWPRPGPGWRSPARRFLGAWRRIGPERGNDGREPGDGNECVDHPDVAGDHADGR